MNNYKFVNQLAAMICASAIFLSGASHAGHHEESEKGHQSAGTIAEIAVAAKGLSTLVAALKAAGLVETLASEGPFTVFAPTDDAFAKIDAATLETLKTDADLLTSILTYHVVPGQASPDQVAGEHATVQGATLNVTGAGNDMMVNDAGLVCGGVQTANATVYMIDTVLMPPAN